MYIHHTWRRSCTLTFFKSSSTLLSSESLDVEDVPEKLRYVIGDDGIGYWIKPKPTMPVFDRLPYDYCEDVIY
jgi:hypothetical protein